VFKLLRKQSSSGDSAAAAAVAASDEVKYKGDLLEHYNLRELYDEVIMTRKKREGTSQKFLPSSDAAAEGEEAAVFVVVPAPLPPRKIGKATYFAYHTIPGDGHLRANPDEGAERGGESHANAHDSAAGLKPAAGNNNKYDLAPLGEVRKSAQEVKLRPLGSKTVREAFPLKPGHFELPKSQIGVAIHKRDRDRTRKKRKTEAAETTKSAFTESERDGTALTLNKAATAN
jgi:hypothetical protein